MKKQEVVQPVVTIITVTFDGEVYSAWVNGKEVSTDRSRGTLMLRTRKRFENVQYIDATEKN